MSTQSRPPASPAPNDADPGKRARGLSEQATPFVGRSAPLMRPNTGPFETEDAALSFLVERLRTELDPEAIFLFGSRAEDRERPDSDFDLLVVLHDDAPAAVDWFAAYRPVAGSGIGADVVPCRLSDFAMDRAEANTIAYAAATRGRLIYLRPGSSLQTQASP